MHGSVNAIHFTFTKTHRNIIRSERSFRPTIKSGHETRFRIHGRWVTHAPSEIHDTDHLPGTRIKLCYMFPRQRVEKRIPNLDTFKGATILLDVVCVYGLPEVLLTIAISNSGTLDFEVK